MALYWKLILARLSARLKFQDRAECGNNITEKSIDRWKMFLKAGGEIVSALQFFLYSHGTFYKLLLLM
jgi:hypothetical protein